LAEIIVTRVWGKGKENSGKAMGIWAASRLRRKRRMTHDSRGLP
jgi:hypothetical protein